MIITNITLNKCTICPSVSEGQPVFEFSHFVTGIGGLLPLYLYLQRHADAFLRGRPQRAAGALVSRVLAVFVAHMAACHVTPTVGVTSGLNMYRAIAGICDIYVTPSGQLRDGV